MAFHDTDEAESTSSERRWVDRAWCLTAALEQAATRALVIKYLQNRRILQQQQRFEQKSIKIKKRTS
jgi:hypothetical protein